MPSAKTVRPSTTSSRPGSSSKRMRTSHVNASGTQLRPTITLSPASKGIEPTGLPAALAATASACKVPKFLRSLYTILQTEDFQIISWVQNADLTPNCVTAFQILEMERFEREILPKYFKHQKFASFQRQLNNFGFRKWTKTQSSGVCTFSHNCFPPDLSSTTTLNMSIRDQWRQKSTQVMTPSTSVSSTHSTTQCLHDHGNVKMKSELKSSNSSSASRRRSMNMSVPTRNVADMSQFADIYHSPNMNASMKRNACRPSRRHQPPLKKLARSNIAMKQDTLDSLSGLDAFCDESLKKQFTLPPLQPHRLLVATSMAPPALSTSCTSNCNDYEIAQASSGFRLTLSQVPTSHSALSMFADSGISNIGLKPCDLKHTDVEAHSYPSIGNEHNGNNSAADAAALQGAFLEPWMWDAQTSSSNFEIGSYPLEFDIKNGFDCKNDFDCKTEFNWQEGTSATNCKIMHESFTAGSSGMSNKELSYQQECGESLNTEEVGLDILLFVE